MGDVEGVVPAAELDLDQVGGLACDAVGRRDLLGGLFGEVLVARLSGMKTFDGVAAPCARLRLISM